MSCGTSYELIFQGRYRLAIQMATFGLTYMQPFSEYDRLALTVNLAQAYKWSGNQQKCNELLDIDWSASRNEFQLCVCALKDDVAGAIELMKAIGADAVPEKNDYREWPVFQRLRKHEKVQEAFQEIFGEPLNHVPPPKEDMVQEKKEKPELEKPSNPDTVH